MTYPPAAPGPRPNVDAAARIVCAVIGVLALVVVLVVIAATDTSSDTGSAQTGGGGAIGAPVAGGLDTSGSGGSGASGDSTPSTAAPATTVARLRATFPFPPGTQVWSERIVQAGTKAYKVPSASTSLIAAKAFYTARLPALGVPISRWSIDKGGPGGEIRGYSTDYQHQTEPTLYFDLRLDGLELRGYTTILVSIQCQPLNAAPVAC